jgi:hypothetical protein
MRISQKENRRRSESNGRRWKENQRRSLKTEGDWKSQKGIMEGEPKEITSKSHEIGSPFLYSISIVKEPGLTTCFFHCYKGLLFGLMVTCGANCWIGNIILALVLK